MASREQQDLAAKIKGTHRNLRIQAKKLGPEKAWNDHLTDSETLKVYAASMKKLSEHYWKSNLAERSGESRITWTVEFSKFYFQSLEILNCRNKELQVIDKIREEPLPDKRLEVDETEFLKISNKQNLLDVGSSFNPFKQFDQFFNVTAIDIAPADKSVFECDFLRVKIDGFQMETSENEIVSLPESFFDIVVFSLLLEYLPSSEQRILCCEKAYNCLRKEGILVILTPDSKNQHINAKLIKNWRYTLALIGFQRIKLTKLKNLTCLVFRKCLRKETALRWAQKYKEEYMTFSLNIPQDKNCEDEVKEEQNSFSSSCTVDNELLFEELPGFVE